MSRISRRASSEAALKARARVLGEQISASYQELWSGPQAAALFVEEALQDLQAERAFFVSVSEANESKILKMLLWIMLFSASLALMIFLAGVDIAVSFWILFVVAFVLMLIYNAVYVRRHESFARAVNSFDDIVREFALAAIEIRQREANEHPNALQSPSEVARYPKPAPQPFGVSHQGAESLVCEWMRYLGAADAQVTRYNADGGIDIESRFFIAQVKNYQGSVPVSEVRAFSGIASVDGRTPLFFTSGSYTAQGIRFAESAGLALFVYDAVNGEIRANSSHAANCMQRGLKL